MARPPTSPTTSAPPGRGAGRLWRSRGRDRGDVGIDAKTLRKHYRQELDHGHIKANAKVAENLYRKAIGEGRESVTAAIFWLKTRARWKETIVNEVTHDVADPLSPHAAHRRAGPEAP